MTTHFDFKWAKTIANEIDPDGEWDIATFDYGFSNALFSEKDEVRVWVWLSRVGCNIHGAYMNLNEADDREKQLRAALEKHKQARAVGKDLARGMG